MNDPRPAGKSRSASSGGVGEALAAALGSLGNPKDQRALEQTWRRKPGLAGWLTSTNSRDVARMYIVTAFCFFALAGLLALLMRLQLARPEGRVLGPDRYNQFFTVHGTTMMFLFAVPIMEGFALYLTPLMVGTRNVAFPRLNLFGYYNYLFGGLLLWIALLTSTGPDAGWFSYVPLSGPAFSPGKRVDVWANMVTMTEISALIAAVEVIVTAFKMRAPGMSLNRIPIYVWSVVVTSFMVVFAMPAVMLASGYLPMDRMTHVNTQFFNPAEGGDALLYQHMFWFFGHPEVYIIFIPATGFVSAILPTFCGRRIFGYTPLVLSLVATAFIGFGLWVHHMFATPIPELGRGFFSASSMMIAIPSGIQVFCWIATIWGGRPRLELPMLWVLAFIALFVLGGLTGVMLASVPIDLQVHDSFFVVAHFHYVLVGGAVFPLFGAFYYWFPKFTGRKLGRALGLWNFWTFLIGFNLTFFPMHLLGLHGMPRRVYTYLDSSGWGGLNMLATVGACALAASVALFVVNAALSLARGDAAGPNPWAASTLEWAISSPPKPWGFARLPTVSGRDPLWEGLESAPAHTGLSVDRRAVLCTSLMDARPEHRYEIGTDSLLPIISALVSGGFFVGLIFTPWAVPATGAALAVLFAIIFWAGTEQPEEMHKASEYLAPPAAGPWPMTLGVRPRGGPRKPCP